MGDNKVNMSLDDIIKHDRSSRSRARGNKRGGQRGRGGRGGNRGGNNQVQNRSRSRSRSRISTTRSQSVGRSGSRTRSQSRGRSQTRGQNGLRGNQRGRGMNRGGANRGGMNRGGMNRGGINIGGLNRGAQTRGRSQSRGQSQSRARSQSRGRSVSRQGSVLDRLGSRSRSRSRGMTPRIRAGLDSSQLTLPPLIRRNRGGQQNGGLRRSNSNPNLNNNPGMIQNRLGIVNQRGAGYRGRNSRPLAIPKQGIQTRAASPFGMGLRSDQILKAKQKQNIILRKRGRGGRGGIGTIRTQTFSNRQRTNSFGSSNSVSQLSISVRNDIAGRGRGRGRGRPFRRNSAGNGRNFGYLNQQALAPLNSDFDMLNIRRGPGSARSAGSNRSRNSNVSTGSFRRKRVGNNFIAKQVLNEKLQMEIAEIQGRPYQRGGTISAINGSPQGINFQPTPTSTSVLLNERFGHI